MQRINKADLKITSPNRALSKGPLTAWLHVITQRVHYTLLQNINNTTGVMAFMLTSRLSSPILPECHIKPVRLPSVTFCPQCLEGEPAECQPWTCSPRWDQSLSSSLWHLVIPGKIVKLWKLLGTDESGLQGRHNSFRSFRWAFYFFIRSVWVIQLILRRGINRSDLVWHLEKGKVFSFFFPLWI